MNNDNVLLGRSLMKLSNNLKEKKKMQNYVILVFFSKKIISKDIKAINNKMKNLNRFVYSSKGSPRDLQLSRTSLMSTERTSKMTNLKN